MDTTNVKDQIIRALEHPEADEGLYFRNLHYLHEEDDREPVAAPQEEILEALHELIAEGRVSMDSNGQEAIFRLNLH